MGFYKFSKYKNKRVVNSLGSFDSMLEFKHYETLLLRERAGEIKSLARQVSIKLGINDKCRIAYRADFVFFDVKQGEWVVFDSKGFETDVFKLKKSWLLDSYSNFRFEIAFKSRVETLHPYNKEGRDFSLFINEYFKKNHKKAKKSLTI